MSETTWSEDAILAQFRDIGQEIEAASGQRATTNFEKEHFQFSRGRQLALNPAQQTEKERLHLETCHSCRQLVAVFADDITHPSRWEILLWSLGFGSAESRELISQHVADDMCQLCQTRLRDLQPVRTLLRDLPPPQQLRNPAANYAASDSAERIVVRSTDDRFVGDVFEQDDSLLLEVRTRERSLNLHLVRFALIGGDDLDPVTGFMVIRPDEEGWFAGIAALSASEVYKALDGRCSVVVAPVDPNELLPADQSSFDASVRRASMTETARNAWLSWANGIEAENGPRILADFADSARVLCTE